MRAPRTVGDIDELVIQAQERGDVAAQADRLHRVAERLPAGRGSLRAEVLVAVGELLQLAGRPEAALHAMREAAADGGTVRVDVRAHVAMARAGAGDRDGARADLAALLRELPTSLDLHLYVGHACTEHEMPAEALCWLTRGVLLAERRGEHGLGLALLLSARCRLRGAQGLPADDWDLAAERLIEELAYQLSAEEPVRERGSLAAVTTRHADQVVIDLVQV